MNEEGMLKPALAGGVLLGILSSLPIVKYFNCFCCAWIVGGGLLAAYLYVKESPTAVKLGSGVVLGLFTGMIGAAVTALFAIPLRLLKGGANADMATRLQKTFEEVPNVPPETREALQALFKRPDIGIILLAFSLIILLATYSLMAMIGGAIGVALFEKRKLDSPSNSAPPDGTPPNQTHLDPPDNDPDKQFPT